MQSVKANKRKTSKGQAVYVSGTAAHQLYEEPVRKKPNKSPKKVNSPKQKTVVKKETTVLPLSIMSVFVLTVAAVLTLVICVQYVQLQTELMVHLKNINKLETELNDLFILNNETDKRINSFVDLDYIYQVATQELGMRYADKNQIYRYHNSGSEYVRQYKEIPQ